MKYYGASPETQIKIGKLLNIQLTGSEQDWEFIHASPHIIKPAISLIKDCSIETSARMAIPCILIESLRGHLETNNLEHPLHTEAFKAIRSNKNIHSAMHFFWLESSSRLNKTYLNSLLKY
ncbi:hypothetical protein [Stenotrophomonas sp. YAU14A_MKIMI4_1]|uniref:hypothetical protein n=1 Tax=Stenotrophomonas sp. YAU14A_MKIMI4_1 TaxID=2072408 RepID=UPI00131F2478|nr:hypothetical protein [Stenotrophomonas sp. YAU14A_MKIMI4_1]